MRNIKEAKKQHNGRTFLEEALLEDGLGMLYIQYEGHQRACDIYRDLVCQCEEKDVGDVGTERGISDTPFEDLCNPFADINAHEALGDIQKREELRLSSS
jgi:hypothetical protein